MTDLLSRCRATNVHDLVRDRIESMDIKEQDSRTRYPDWERVGLPAATSSSRAVGEDGSGGLRRDLELLEAGGKEPAFPAPTLVRRNMKHLSNEFQGLYAEKLRQLENNDETKSVLKFSSLNLRSIPLEKVANSASPSSSIKKSEVILMPHLENLKSQFVSGDQMALKFSEELKEVLCDNGQSKAEGFKTA